MWPMFTFKPPSVEKNTVYVMFRRAKRHVVMVRLHTLSRWLPKHKGFCPAVCVRIMLWFLCDIVYTLTCWQCWWSFRRHTISAQLVGGTAHFAQRWLQWPDRTRLVDWHEMHPEIKQCQLNQRWKFNILFALVIDLVVETRMAFPYM